MIKQVNFNLRSTKVILIFVLVVLFTTTTFTQALELKTEPRELGKQIENVCNDDLNCLNNYKFIFWDLFQTENKATQKINYLYVLLYLYSL